jgi:hypothetical protein
MFSQSRCWRAYKAINGRVLSSGIPCHSRRTALTCTFRTSLKREADTHSNRTTSQPHLKLCQHHHTADRLGLPLPESACTYNAALFWDAAPGNETFASTAGAGDAWGTVDRSAATCWVLTARDIRMPLTSSGASAMGGFISLFGRRRRRRRHARSPNFHAVVLWLLRGPQRHGL